MIENNLFIESKLPPVLTKVQLYEQLKKYQAGDLEARNIVITHNIRLVLNVVNNRFWNTQFDKKELVSIGLIGLIKSVDTFDITKNFEFSTYAARIINNEILMFMRKNKYYIKEDNLSKIIQSSKNGKQFELENILSDENIDFVSDYETKETNYEVQNLIELLPDREKEIIKLYFGFYDRCYTQTEIAIKFNTSQSIISRIIKKILADFKKQLLQQEKVNIKKIY